MENFFLMCQWKIKNKQTKKLWALGKVMIIQLVILLDYEYFSKHYKLITIDLFMQTNCNWIRKSWYKGTN